MTKGTYDTTYMKKLTGSRLKTARGAIPHIRDKISRQKLTDILNSREDRPVIGDEKGTLSLETLRKWEYGENPINIEWLPAICDTLDCDIGFLFGEYEERSRINADISAETGLSELAIQKLKRLHADYPEYITIISALITNENFEYLLYLLKKRFQYTPKSDDIKPIIEKVGKGIHLKNARQYMEFQRQNEVSIELDEGRILAKKSNLLDSLIVSAISSMIPDMASEYGKPEND